jgi:hypothetical protein
MALGATPNGRRAAGSALPVRKVSVAAAAGAAVTVGVWVTQQVGGIQVPPETAAALTTLVSFLFGYVTPA